MRSFSTIEMTILGIAWARGPCTTYTLMRELSTSESTYHKSRAGTAYSIAKRLIGFGLLVVAEPSEPGRERLVTITQPGIQALREWVAPPVPQVDIAHSADFLRLRFFFLGVLDPPQRLEFVDSSIVGLKELLHRIEVRLPENEEIGEYYGVLATASAILETRARIQWLEMVRELVASPLAEDEPWAKRVEELLNRAY
ncbi:MAG: hypothetical protein JNM85_09840 [Chthonomonas sp.]|nr:hypothetical protein [Chthonomonas sp.]